MAEEEKEFASGYTNMLNKVLGLGVDTASKVVLQNIMRFYNKNKGYSYPSITLLMNECQLSRQGVINAIKKLERLGYIRKETIKGRGNRYFLSEFCLYEKKHGLFTSQQNILVNEVDASTDLTSQQNRLHPSTDLTTPVNEVDPTNTNINTNTITNNNTSDSKESDSPPGAFKGDSNNSTKDTKSSKTKKVKKDYSNEIKEVVDYLNKKTNRKYKPGTAETKRLISARLKDYSVEDLKAVIDFKVEKWLEAEWYDKQGNLVQGKNYLRPSTLFRESNFENYINELPSQEKEAEKKELPPITAEEFYDI